MKIKSNRLDKKVILSFILLIAVVLIGTIL